MAKFLKYITTTHNGDIGLAKINIFYNATMNKLNKAILIDICKTFDIIDKDILRDTLIRTLNHGALIDLLLDILDLYDTIDLNIQGATIYSKTGIIQGIVY